MSYEREIELAPRASALVESLRDMGHSLQTALADLIDNSIAAGAENIDLLAEIHEQLPAIGVLDDGSGMAQEELFEAMRPGTRGPLDVRDIDDLGRFGLGLKTASFSQCRRLTVLTRKGGINSCASWDLDVVAVRDKWVVEVASSDEVIHVRWADKLKRDGTLVIWEKLDRMIDNSAQVDYSDVNRLLCEARMHLEFVFHRFLSGQGVRKISMSLNDRKLEAFDPFHSNHIATQHHPEEKIRLGRQTITVKPITLPHYDKVSKDDWERLAGPEGYVGNQGFYLYRNHRLILHGTWFRLARKLELTKLSRISIDIPNTLDAEWKIDVRKASAQPPPSVRKRLHKIIKQFVIPSKRTFVTRGTKLTEDSRLPVWVRKQDKNQISYEIEMNHPLVATFCDTLNSEKKGEFLRIMQLLTAALPIQAMYMDISANPENVQPQTISHTDLEIIVSKIWNILRSQELDSNQIEEWMRSADPFRNDWERTLKYLNKLKLQ